MKAFERYLRFTDPIWNATLRTARTFGRREGIGRRLFILVAVLAALTALLAGTASFVAGQSTEPPPRFSNHEPLPPDGRDAGEPSLGVTHTLDPQKGLLGRVMYIAVLETLRATFDDCTAPARDVWEDVSPVTTPPTTLDPILFTDPITGRTFTSQLAGKTSIMSFSDNEGTTWTQSQGAGINSGVDHQTVGGGPYPAGDPGSLPSSHYPHAVYYCSQDAATAQCALSRDGGQTFGPAVPIYAITECGGLHGHIKVGPDGTAYVPNPSCNRGLDPLGAGEPGIVRSMDAGVTWQVRTVQGAETIGSSDPAVDIGANGTLYFGYEDNGRAMVAVSGNRGDSWSLIRDVSTSIGLRRIVFPQVTAGDDDRAAIAFLGTDYGGPENPEGEDATIPAVWYQYVAVTYDSGDHWVTTNATPGDPVQRGTVCGLGLDCDCCRNLLDFNDVTHDREGRILTAYSDGCIGGCVNGPPNSGTAVAKIARQVSGRRLLAAFDPTGTEPPSGVRLRAFLREPPLRVELAWDEPDDRGTTIQGYRVYRRPSGGTTPSLLASVGPGARAYTDATVAAGVAYLYQVRAFNANGEGSADACSEVAPIVVPPRHACELPGDQANTDPAGDQRSLSPASLDILSLHVAEPAQPDRVSRLVFTLKVSNLPAILQPGNAWFILWNRPLPDAAFDRNYVALRVDATGAPRFVYGQITPPNANQALDTGLADSGSVSATDDTIVISIANAKVDGVAAGQDLTDLQVRTFTSNVNGQPVTQLSADDFSAPGLYTLVGNASCDPRPLAMDDNASTPEGQAITIDVVANDVDGNGDPLTVTGVTQGANGSVAISGVRSVTYTPASGFVGTDLFDYTVSDPGGLSDTGTVTVTVFRSAPIQDPIADDAAPDQVDGVDRDGRYTLSWSFPPPPDSQPCGFRVEQSSSSSALFVDDAFEPLVAGSNSKWTGNAPQWTTSLHPDTETTGYHLAYTDSSDFTLTLNDAVALPAGPTKIQLSFDSFEDIEDGFDFASVEVSADGGSFQALASFTGLFSGRRVVDLSDFAGRDVRLRFRLQSDMLISFPVVLGWYIDNIAIEAANFAPIATTGAAARTFNATVTQSGTYSYRIAGLFGTGCAVLGPYSNVRQITVDLTGGVSQAPTAEFTATPNPATVNQSVTFDGSASHDNDTLGADPPIASYFWGFGDGSTQTTTGPTTTHTYTAAGTYRATLTVTDNDGETASTERFIEVAEPTQPGVLKVTGGGSIPSGGGEANFGFNVKKPLGGSPSGHLSYDDKGRRVKVGSESVTSLSVSGNRATFGGACKVNKVSGFTYTVEVVDNGEAGTTDTFLIRLSNGYEASGTLTQGNIEIHKPAKTTGASTNRPVPN
jgi:PKD repeat protein